MWVSIRFSRESLKLRQLQLPRSGPNRQPPESPHLERDDFSSNRHPALSFCLSMIFSENRYPLFRIMLQPQPFPHRPVQGIATPVSLRNYLDSPPSAYGRVSACACVKLTTWPSRPRTLPSSPRRRPLPSPRPRSQVHRKSGDLCFLIRQQKNAPSAQCRRS